MSAKMAGSKAGRPFVYQSEDERPITVSVRIPRELYEQLDARRKQRRTTMSEALLEGARLWLDTPADPRDLILSDDNTVIQEVQGMIRAAVQAEIGKLTAYFGPNRTRAHLMPELETPSAPTPALDQALAEPASELSHDDNTVIQEGSAQPRERRGSMRQRILTLLSKHSEGLSAEEMRVYLKPEKHLGDTLQGMQRKGVVRVEGRGREKRYFVG
jgi:hypothetical protein